MPSQARSADARRPAPRLYLTTPPIGEVARLADTLDMLLATVDIAAVLLSLASADERTLLNRIKALAPLVQGRGAALLLDGHAALAARSGADGAHLGSLEEFTTASATLKPDRIAGCGGLTTRHDAMVAAESGADYVMFGEPDVRGHGPALEAIIERVEWWADVFEVPCVSYAGSLEEVAPLVAAGADFVALGPFVFEDSRGPAAAIQDAAQRLLMPETVA